MDPFMLVMLGLIVLMIFFMFRNGKKRQQAMQDMQSNMRPGAEVMLQSGIFATVEEVDEEDNRITVRSGTSTLVVHRNAVAQIVTPADGGDDFDIAPDDDPEFGERIAEANGEESTGSDRSADTSDSDSFDAGEGDKPKA